MLVTFSCEAYENIIMFGDVARHLLIMMGNSGTVPGAIVAADIPQALLHLEEGLAKESQQGDLHNAATDDEEEPISLAHRALPLINMLKAAKKNDCHIMWK